MVTEYTNRELGMLVSEVKKAVDTGFQGVHERQDHTNGNVMRNSEFRLKADATIKTFKWLIAVFGIGTIVNVLVVFTDVIK